MGFYKKILQKTITDKHNLKQIIQQSDKNLHSLKTSFMGLPTQVDKKHSNNDTLQILFTKDLSMSDLLRLCSSEYTTLSLNMLENSPQIIKRFDILYDVYMSICNSDTIETKYIDKHIDLDVIFVFFSIIFFVIAS